MTVSDAAKPNPTPALSVPGARNWRELGRDCLTPLCAAAGLSHRLDALLGAFELLTGDWGSQPISAEPAWESDVCSDHSPFEPSLALSPRGNVVRLLVEAQGAEATTRAQADAGARLTRVLAEHFGLATARCETLQDLFFSEPAGPTEGRAALQGRFGIWHALELDAESDRPSAKVYFDLSSWGPGLAPALTEEALSRIGFGQAWPALSELLATRPGGLDQLAYFSVDLSDNNSSRVKVYLRHHHATALHLDRLFSTAAGYRPSSLKEALRQLEVGSGPFSARPVVASYSFTRLQPARPSQATLYFPLESYADSDQDAARRLARLFSSFELPGTELEACVQGLAPRPLDKHSGLISYVSFREEHGAARSTVYFSPLAYGHERTSTRRIKVGSIESVAALVERYERDALTDQPFFRRLRREPVSLERLWLLMANFELAIIREFPRRLASLTARAPTDEIRALLTAQLHDELGGGDFERAHKALFGRLMRGLEPYRVSTPGALSAAEPLGRALELEYVGSDPWFGVGASLLVEVFGKQVDCFVAEEFARQQEVTGETLEWLALHTELEVEHADDSARIAELIPDGDAEAQAIAGAEHIASAAHAFFNRMYAVCFND